MGELVSIFHLSIYVLTGMFIARGVFPSERPLVRLWLGGVCALVLLLWLPALIAFLVGFTVLAQWGALLLCAALGCFALLCIKKRNRLAAASGSPGGWLYDRPVLIALCMLFLFGVILFFTHTLLMKDGAIYSGQSTFGDLPLHLGLVTSLARQGTFPPAYSIFPGTAVGYPFLCDSISATFYVLGAGLRFSMLLPAIFAYALVLLGVYCFFERWLAGRGVGLLATLLFFCGSGFGFAYFFDLLKLNPGNLTDLFAGFYHTPNNFTDVGLRWVNPIADMLIPQRATLFGWALLFPSLYLLRRAAFEGETRLFLPLGLLAGCIPLVHTHSFFALGVLSAVYLLRALWQREKTALLRGWLVYGVVALLLSAPQLLLFTFRQAGGFLQLQFNWDNTTDAFLWFYIKNMGLLFLLMPLAFFRLDAKERWFYAGALFLWLLSECVQFQPNPYDNNKLLFVWFLLTCGIVAKLLQSLYQALRDWRGIRYLASITLCTLFLSGTLTLGRELVSEYQLFDEDAVAAAAFIEQNTAPDALFLTANNHNNFVAALTGRNILCGTGAYLFFHGLDYQLREQDVYSLYEEPAICFDALNATYGIDYVLFSDYEWYSYYCDEAYYQERFPLVYENSGIKIYGVV